MLVSVDLGYGYTKAVKENSGEKVMFPSTLAMGGVEMLLEYCDSSAGHRVAVKKPGEPEASDYYVGDLALKSGRAVQGSLARDKHLQQNSVIFALTAAYLLGAEGPVDLALGLPIAYYRTQKDDLKKTFRGVEAQLSVNDGPERMICFDSVYVFPQGVGAVYAGDADLPDTGLVGVVDVGYHTTDYLLLECNNGAVQPVPAYAGSVEVGASTAMQMFGDRFTQKTGIPLSLPNIQGMWKRDRLTVRGREVDVAGMKQKAREMSVSAIADGLQNSWAEKIDFIDRLIFCGGGAVEFAEGLKQYFPNMQLIPDAQFANASGFLKMAQAGR